MQNKLKELKTDAKRLNAYNKSGINIKEGGSATLAIVNKIKEGEFQLLLLGDSPAYVIDVKGNIVSEYGTETAGDNQVSGTIGIRSNGDVFVEGSPIKKILKLNKGEKVVIGSDYLSDGLETYGNALTKKIAQREKMRKDGGFYDYNGRYFAPSELTDSEKRALANNFVSWNPGSEDYFQSMKRGLASYNEAMQNPQKYISYRNDSPEAKKQIELWQKNEKRNLGEFLNVSSGDEFYKKVNGPDSWKKDDATVVVVEGYN